jgi:hypothetical protein
MENKKKYANRYLHKSRNKRFFFSNKNLKLKGPEILFSFWEGLMTRKGSF